MPDVRTETHCPACAQPVHWEMPAEELARISSHLRCDPDRYGYVVEYRCAWCQATLELTLTRGAAGVLSGTLALPYAGPALQGGMGCR